VSRRPLTLASPEVLAALLIDDLEDSIVSVVDLGLLLLVVASLELVAVVHLDVVDLHVLEAFHFVEAAVHSPGFQSHPWADDTFHPRRANSLRWALLGR